MLESDVIRLWDCITVIEAQEQLKRLQASDWHRMKKTNRDKIHKDLFDKAYPKQNKVKTTSVSQKDINKILGLKNG